MNMEENKMLQEYVVLAICTEHLRGDKVSYFIELPDLDRCAVTGDTLQEAILRAENTCALWISTAEKHGREIPVMDHERIFSAQTQETRSAIFPIRVNMVEYRKKLSQKAVKKNVTIPSWLNEIAEEKNCNYSQVLQNALKETLGSSYLEASLAGA